MKQINPVLPLFESMKYNNLSYQLAHVPLHKLQHRHILHQVQDLEVNEALKQSVVQQILSIHN